MPGRRTRESSDGIRRVLINDRIARISSMQKNINPKGAHSACYFDELWDLPLQVRSIS